MDITKFKRWNKLLSALNTRKLFTSNETANLQKMYLCAPISLANSIQVLYPEILNKSDLKVCIAGAAMLDTFNDGEAYKIFEKLFDGNKNWKFDFIGPEISCKEQYPLSIKKDIGNNVTRKFYDIKLAEYVEKHGLPDLLVMNCPGFEQFYQSWLIDDQGLRKCIEQEIPIIGSSYGNDEAELDQAYARAYGLKVSEIFDNQYTLGFSPVKHNKDAKDSMNWSGQCWKLQAGNLSRDQDLIELLSSQYDFLREVSGNSMENIFSNRFDLTHKDGGKTFYKIGMGLAFDIEDKTIVDGYGNIIIDDIELDKTYLGKDLTTTTQSMLIILTIRRDYMDEINKHIEVFEGDDLDIRKGAKEFLAMMGEELGDVNIEGLTSAILGKDKREMSQYEMEIDNILISEKYSELGLYTDEQLSSFMNEDHQNLMHISALVNSIELYDIARESGIKPEVRDGDNFNVADICAEKDSLEVFEKVMNDFPNFDIQDVDPKGFNVMYRAMTYNSPRMIGALNRLGVEPSEGFASKVFKNLS